ncbi:MAG: hypothetical protein PVH26_06280, partial [Desulfosarcina sp.]
VGPLGANGAVPAFPASDQVRLHAGFQGNIFNGIGCVRFHDHKLKKQIAIVNKMFNICLNKFD